MTLSVSEIVINPPRWRARAESRSNRRSVVDVPGAGEIHRDTGRLCGVDRILIPHRSARLDDSAHPAVEQYFGAVGEREKGVGGRDRSASALFAGALHRQPAG